MENAKVEKATSEKGKIGILIESHFDELEFVYFNVQLPWMGYQVEYLSYLWGAERAEYIGNDHNQTVTVTRCVTKADLAEFAGIILIGGYAMDRLRYAVARTDGALNDSEAVKFLRRCASMEHLKIGTICHSLWLYCAAPDLLKGKRVTCAHNIIDDVVNAGGLVQYSGSGSISTFVDGNLVSAKHPDCVAEFLHVFLHEIQISKHMTPVPGAAKCQ